MEEGVSFKIFMGPTNEILEVQPYILMFDFAPLGAFFCPFWPIRAFGIEGQVEQHFTDLLMLSVLVS